MKTTIYIIATPIGTVKDISSHAIEVLKNSDLIVCEDTRSTQHLLNILNIQHSKLESLHLNNEKEKSLRLIEYIRKCKLRSVALVSDAGTPAISDPGAVFISMAHSHNIEIRNIPGPSSLVCALAASGFCHPRHVFSGFLSRNAKKQKDEFHRWCQASPCIGVFFESPKRILETLKNLNDFFHDDTKISLSREISKQFEENKVMNLSESQNFLESKENILGEFVVCVDVLPTSKNIVSTIESNKTLKEDCKIIAQKYHINTKDLYSYIAKCRSGVHMISDQ